VVDLGPASRRGTAPPARSVDERLRIRRSSIPLWLTPEESLPVILAALEDPPEGLAELRAVLLNEHEWLQREGLD